MFTPNFCQIYPLCFFIQSLWANRWCFVECSRFGVLQCLQCFLDMADAQIWCHNIRCVGACGMRSQRSWHGHLYNTDRQWQARQIKILLFEKGVSSESHYFYGTSRQATTGRAAQEARAEKARNTESEMMGNQIQLRVLTVGGWAILNFLSNWLDFSNSNIKTIF